MRIFRSQSGVTLIEMMVVVAIMVFLSAIAARMTGFLAEGKEQSLNSERSSLQAAVDGYRSANASYIPVRVEAGDTVTKDAASISSCLPSSSGSLTIPPINNCFIDLAELVDRGFLFSTVSVTTSSSDNAAGNTGIYSWVITTNGDVAAFDKATGLRVPILGD